MKKIIAAFDGYNFSSSAKDYVIFMARHCNAHLVGVFLDDFTYHTYHFSDLAAAGDYFDAKLEELNREDETLRKESVRIFEEACQKAGVDYSVHRDKNIALQELLHETIYSDLLIIDKKETFTHFKEEVPSVFIKDLLAETQCPVMVVPSKYHNIEKIVLLYDGEPSSVHAVKMFSYMFPTLKHLETEVLVVKPEKEEKHLPDNRLMKEFMKRHFPSARYILLKGEAEEEIVAYLRNQPDGLLAVLGAYQRGMVSRWFKKSMADHLMLHVNVPLFIAHNT